MKLTKLVILVFCIFNIVSISLALNSDSIVGMWLFDDGKGDTAKDSSGNGLDGTLINAPEWVDDGKFGGALEFEFAKANNVRVPIPHNDTVTVAAWALFTGLPTTNIGLIHVQEGDIENADPGSKTIGIWVENTGTLWGRIIPKGQGNVNLPKNKSLDSDTWYHIAMVVDADSGKATEYVNAEEVGSVDYPGQLNNYGFANIGRQGDETWEGMIDEVIVFSEALSVSDLKELMEGIENALPVDAKDKVAVVWAKMKSDIK